MIPQFPVYLFDVDGTLVDSAKDICGAIQEALAGRGRNDLDSSYLRRFIGLHLTDLFQDVFPEDSTQQTEDLIVHYRGAYQARKHTSTSAYPGVLEALSALPGRKSTATTKGTPTTRVVLKLFGLLPFFDHVQGTDGFPAKPEPDVIHAALAALGARASDCLMVGDSTADMAAGRAAGVAICAVRYGYGDTKAMARYEPDFWVDDLRELL